jgi:hypothetical protein
MAKFKWSASFWQLNGAYLAAYAECADGPAVIARQQVPVRRSRSTHTAPPGLPAPTDSFGSFAQEFMADIEGERQAKAELKATGDMDYGSNWGLPSESESEGEGEGEGEGEVDPDGDSGGAGTPRETCSEAGAEAERAPDSGLGLEPEPEPHTEPGPAAEEQFLCEFDCGFRGGYAAVEAHEAVCAVRG